MFRAFSHTDFTEDLKKITVPALVMHGDDDQVVPYADHVNTLESDQRQGSFVDPVVGKTTLADWSTDWLVLQP